MLARPILEIYVIWHPDDVDGRRVADGILGHFRGTTYSGLLGGAVDVYVRSAGWLAEGAPPRPIPFMTPLPNGLPSSQLTVVVPILGAYLARAVATDARWRRYLSEMMELARCTPYVDVYPLDIDAIGATTSQLRTILEQTAYLPSWCVSSSNATCREIAHQTATMIGDPLGQHLQIFISHTKRITAGEDPDGVDRLLTAIRSVIASRTRLTAFFDDHDIPAGSNWYETLLREASGSALLVVRTDLYAGSEWCQREVLVAKEAGMPIVSLRAVLVHEERGSFLMDHIPSVQLGRNSEQDWILIVERALDQLVDEALKRALWRHQAQALSSLGFRWLPSSAPEPVTLSSWLRALDLDAGSRGQVLVMHPDPPLGPEEARVIDDIAVLAGFESGAIDVLTPRTFSSRGGRTL